MENTASQLTHLFAADGSTFTVVTKVQDGDLLIHVFRGHLKPGEESRGIPMASCMRTARVPV